MRKKTLGFIALFVSFSIYFSCIDEGVDVPGGYQQAPETELLAYAKKLVGENGEGCSLIDLQKGNSGSRAVTDYSTVATPLWEKAKTERHGDEEVLIVPLQNEDEIYSQMFFEEEHKDRLYQTKTFSRLVIRNRNGETYPQVFTYLPSRNYAKNRQEVLDTMGFSPLAVKYYGTILISDLSGTFQQGFFYERGVPTIHFTAHRHSDSAPVRILDDTTATDECHEHSHANSLQIRLNLSRKPAVSSRSYSEGDETDLICMFCGGSALTCSCFIVDGNYIYCNDCGNLKGQCICPFIQKCPVCGLPKSACICTSYICPGCGRFSCICNLCPDCYSNPCICGSSGGDGNEPDLGGGTSGGGSGIGGGDGSDDGNPGTEPLSCKNLEEVLKYIIPRLAKKGILLNKDNIVETDDCSNKNASPNYANNWIEICVHHFYGKPIEDQTSIIYHEYYHLINDVVKHDSWDSYIKYPKDLIYYDTPPESIMAIYRKMHLEEYEMRKAAGI